MVPVEDCAICRTIPDSLTLDRVRDEDAFPPAMWELLEVPGTRTDDGNDSHARWACPTCGRHYLYGSTYESQYGGAEELITLIRVKQQ